MKNRVPLDRASTDPRLLEDLKIGFDPEYGSSTKRVDLGKKLPMFRDFIRHFPAIYGRAMTATNIRKSARVTGLYPASLDARALQ
jgi:hypothetical protein